MLHLPQELTMNHVDTSGHVSKLYSNFDGSKMINFGTQFRQTGRKYNGMYGDRSGGGEGIEFSAQNDESGVISPPLWKTSPPKSPPTETTPLQSHAYNHHHYRLLSPTSRSQAIARGKEELMQMVKNMPETTYELSLKDLVEHSRIQGVGHTTVVEDRELGKIFNTNKTGETKKKKTGKAILRSGSMDNGPFLLKMFIPIFLGRKKKKSLITGTCAKVSPRPIEGEKVDKDWWKKRFSGVGETDNNGSGSSGGSGGSSNSSRSRSMNAFLPGCLSFLNNKKIKSKEQKSSLF